LVLAQLKWYLAGEDMQVVSFRSLPSLLGTNRNKYRVEVRMAK